ncbi:MAG: Rrf2 family transcriptional regulator [Halobacteriovoraceae bacterium]|nr:Rrf2 family transcriptional regulator [Halobacteriovoraceae bacterium]
MLKINKKLEYALIVLKFMETRKNPGEKTSVREICNHFSCSFNTVSKIMQAMTDGGILKSVRGVNGGYRQVRALSDINFKELFILIEKKENHSICHSNKGPCDLFSTCNIITPLNRLNDRLIGYLAKLSLRDILLEESISFEQGEAG